jgi:hypothetical protein
MPEAVWQQPASAPPTSRVLGWLAWATGAITIVISLAVIERAPMPWLDEVYLVSVSNTVAQGPARAARLVPPPEWVADYEKIYGPVFFHTEAAAIRAFGLSPFSGRITGWAGSVLLALSTIWLILIVGGTTEMAAIAFALVALTPEFSVIARNGRMDSMAIGFEFAGMACLLAALGRPRRAIPWGLVAGGCWAMAVLSTPRTLPFLAGLAVAAPLLIEDRETRGSFLQAIACLYGVVFAGLYLWSHHLGITVIGWFFWLWDRVKDDAYNIVLPGRRRYWELSVQNAATPLAVLLAALGIAFYARRIHPRLGGVLALGAPSRRRMRFWYLVLATSFNALFYLVVTNYVFGMSQYFVLPMLIVMLMATSVLLRAQPNLGRPMFAFWLMVALAFGGIRGLKYIEIWQTWDMRDPKRMQQFVEQWVPKQSIVFGDDQYYFYAVEAAGSVYRTFNVLNSGVDQMKNAEPRKQTVLPVVENSFLLWPVGDPGVTFPGWFNCAKDHVVARFESTAEPSGVERLLPFAFSSYLHGYPTTILYRVPPGCPITGSP